MILLIGCWSLGFRELNWFICLGNCFIIFGWLSLLKLFKLFNLVLKLVVLNWFIFVLNWFNLVLNWFVNGVLNFVDLNWLNFMVFLVNLLNCLFGIRDGLWLSWLLMFILNWLNWLGNVDLNWLIFIWFGSIFIWLNCWLGIVFICLGILICFEILVICLGWNCLVSWGLICVKIVL